MQRGTTENLNFGILSPQFSATYSVASGGWIESISETKFLIDEIRNRTRLPGFLPTFTFCDPVVSYASSTYFCHGTLWLLKKV